MQGQAAELSADRGLFTRVAREVVEELLELVGPWRAACAHVSHRRLEHLASVRSRRRSVNARGKFRHLQVALPIAEGSFPACAFGVLVHDGVARIGAGCNPAWCVAGVVLEGATDRIDGSSSVRIREVRVHAHVVWASTPHLNPHIAHKVEGVRAHGLEVALYKRCCLRLTGLVLYGTAGARIARVKSALIVGGGDEICALPTGCPSEASTPLLLHPTKTPKAVATAIASIALRFVLPVSEIMFPPGGHLPLCITPERGALSLAPERDRVRATGSAWMAATKLEAETASLTSPVR